MTPSARAWLKVALDGVETNCGVGYGGVEVVWGELVGMLESIFFGV
jgi:hypothetical protein